MAHAALLLPRKTKPQQFARVNLAHPMARHLSSFYLYSNSISSGPVLWDAVTGSPGTVGGTNITFRDTSEGKALYCNAPTSNVAWNRPRLSPASIQVQLGTVIARMRRVTSTGGGSGAFAAPVYTRAASHGGVFVGFTTAGYVITGVSTSNGIEGSTKAGTTDRTNSFVTIGGSAAYAELGTKPAGSAQTRLWENGVKIGDSVAGGNYTGTGEHTLTRVGRDGTGYYGTFTGDILWFATFDRYLTDAEHLWWHQNSYDVLEQQFNPSFLSLPSDAAAAFMARQGLNIPQAVNRASTY